MKNQENTNKTCRTLGITAPMKCIESRSYEDNVELCEIAFFATVQEIGYSAFSGCVKLEKVDLCTAGVEKIGDAAFCRCTGLRNVYLSEELKYIGDYAFAECENLEEIVFPKGICHIGEHAFQNCKKLRRVVFPGHLSFVGNYAFKGCKGIEFVRIDSNISSQREIPCSRRLCDEEGIFRGCENIKEVVIGPAVTKLPWHCFDGCIALENVTLMNPNVRFLTNTFAAVPFFKGKDRYVGRDLVNCFGMKGDYTIKDGTQEICDGAFFGCKLTGVEIPESVRKIGYFAFKGYKGRGITVPPYTTYVMKSAFSSFYDILLPMGIKPHSRQNDEAVKYYAGDYRLLMNTIARCEAIANSPHVDINEFFKVLAVGKGVSFHNLDQDWRMIYLTRIKGVENLFTADRFFEIREENFDEYFDLLMMYGLSIKTAKTVKHLVYSMAAGVFSDVRSKDAGFRTRILKLIRRLLGRGASSIKYRKKPASKMTDWPVLMDLLASATGTVYKSYHAEVCAAQNVMNCVKHLDVWSMRCKAHVDEDLIKAIDADSPAMFFLRLDLLGKDPDEIMIGYALDKRAMHVVRELYERVPWLRERIPLKNLILNVCMNWKPDEAVGLIGLLCKECSETLAEIQDGLGADCLWYSLFNQNLHGKNGGWMRGNGLERFLKDAGCRGDRVNGLGWSYDEIIDGWESIDECEARKPKTDNPVSKIGTNAVPVPVMNAIPATKNRMQCPPGFVNAKDFADTKGMIEPWKCHANGDIAKLWIPQEIVAIGNFAFNACPNLEEVDCEECGGGPKLSVGLMSFAGCKRLKKVSLPVRIAALGAGAFRDNAEFCDFSVAEGHYTITKAGHIFDGCPNHELKLAALN